MAGRRRAAGGAVATTGYLLSPLSWWNDLFVNLPLAYGFATLVSLFSEDLFGPALIAGYWLTNVAGLVMLHRGAEEAVRPGARGYGRRDLLVDLAVSAGYTVLIAALVRVGVLTSPV